MYIAYKNPRMRAHVTISEEDVDEAMGNSACSRLQKHTCNMSLTRYSTSGAKTRAASSLRLAIPMDSAIADMSVALIWPPVVIGPSEDSES